MRRSGEPVRNARYITPCNYKAMNVPTEISLKLAGTGVIQIVVSAETYARLREIPLDCSNSFEAGRKGQRQDLPVRR